MVVNCNGFSFLKSFKNRINLVECIVNILAKFGAGDDHLPADED